MKVIFSDRAYVALLSETLEKIKTETGGIFLGYYEDDTWYVVESIDPGPHSIFEVAYFEYDQKYVNHLINKIARLYKKNLSLLGLWHRHPGSFDIFSNTDDGTNKTYSMLAPQGAISALVNIDPEFRLTVYHVPHDLRYRKISYQVGDEYFPEGVLSLLTTEEVLKKINKKPDDDFGSRLHVRTAPRVKFSKMMESICASAEKFEGLPYKEEMLASSEKEEFWERISGEILEDLDYLSTAKDLAVKLRKNRYFLCLFDDSEESETRVYFSLIESLDKFVFIYKNDCYGYSSGLFSRIAEEAAQGKGGGTSFWDKFKSALKRS